MTSTFTRPVVSPSADDESLAWPFLPLDVAATITLFGDENFKRKEVLDDALAQAANSVLTTGEKKDETEFYFDGYTVQV